MAKFTNKDKTVTGIVMAVCLVAILVIDYFSKIAFDAFILMIALIAVDEFDRLLLKSGNPTVKHAPHICAGAVYAMFLIGVISEWSAVAIFLAIGGVVAASYGIVLVVSLFVLKSKNQTDEFRLAANMTTGEFAFFKANNTLIAIFYPTLLMIFLQFLNHIEQIKISAFSSTTSPVGLFALAQLFAIVCLCDTFAMAFGTLIKGKKLCPKISPLKTISGALFGLLGGVIGSVATYFAFKLIFGGLFATVSFLPFVFVGLVVSVFAQIGDLFESYVKRRAGVKEAGDFFMSHGGVVDRFDSIMLAAPILFVCLLIVF